MRFLARILITAWLLGTGVQLAVAESNLVSLLRRLDTNRDGELEPGEIDRRARRYLQPIADETGLRLSRTNSIERVEEAIVEYQEDRARSRSRNVVPARSAGVQGFEADPESPLVPGFGLPEVRYPYTAEDLEDADASLRRNDRNDDGVIDRAEARRGRWNGEDPFRSDFNLDDRLNRLELAQRYARRRVLDDRDDIERAVERRTQAWERDNDDDDDRSSSRRSNEREDESSRSSRYLAYSVFSRFDRNQNGRLEENETYTTGIDRGAADFDRDGSVSRDELDRWLFREMDGVASDLSEVLPEWFFERDANGDGQIAMSEFAKQWSDATLEEFTGLDTDQDGILTTAELLQSRAIVGGRYANQTAQILMPRAVVISEIEVAEETVIGDLNVQLSITHTSTDQLDGFLVGPDGQQVELFTGVGRNDDHFDDTVFDDEAGDRITRSRPPFRGSFQPEAVDDRKPSLSHFKGKSLHGVWQLIVRATRSDRAGVLHHWSLIVKPAAEQTGEQELVTSGTKRADADD